MIFIRPQILRDGQKAASRPNAKYNNMRDHAARTASGQVCR